QRDKEKTNLIAKLDDDIKEIKQEQIAINLSVQGDTSIPKSPINSESQVTPQSSVSPPIEDDSNAKNSPNVTQHICSESKTLEEKEDDEFIDLVYKEKVSNEIRQKRREKKFQDSADTSSNISHEQKNIQSIFNESGDREPEGISSDQVQGSEIKILYNQKVEQGIMHELNVCSKESISIQDIDVQIPELPLESILIVSNEVTP
ncbi:3069_t:CDS:2, partial [Racocetra fulgida]